MQHIFRFVSDFTNTLAVHQLAAEASETLIERRPKREHSTDLTKEIK